MDARLLHLSRSSDTHVHTHIKCWITYSVLSRELPFHLSSQKHTKMWQAPLAYLVLLHSSFIYSHAVFFRWNCLLYKWHAVYSTLCRVITPQLSHIETGVIAAITCLLHYVVLTFGLVQSSQVRSTKVAQTSNIQLHCTRTWSRPFQFQLFVICRTFKTSMN